MQIRKIVDEDVPHIKQMLRRAFDDDPLMNWIILQDDRHVQRGEQLFEMSLRLFTMPHGLVYTNPERSGAALWKPPDYKLGLLTALCALPYMIRASGWRQFWPKTRANLDVESLIPKTPHYCLYVLGVEPALQGQGIGSALMGPVLRICDRDQVGAYLETHTEAGVRFYQRHGFQVRQAFEVPGGGPEGWTMWREPVPDAIQ